MKSTATKLILYILGLLLISSVLYYPEISGKKLGAHDKISWVTAAKEFTDYQAKGETIKWTNRVFSGMPLFTIAGGSTGNYVSYITYATSWIPEFIRLSFSIMLCGFLGLLLLGVRPPIAFIMGICFGLNTYFIDASIASHITKIYTVGYSFLLISGLIQFFRSGKLYALAVYGIALSLSLASNHTQITYYVIIMCLFIGGYFVIAKAINNDLRSLLKQSLAMVVVTAIAGGTHLSSIIVLNDYSKETMRGGKTELVKSETNSTGETGGLDINYAFSWSYVPSELTNLIVPNAMGGSSNYKVKNAESKLARAIGNTTGFSQLPMYWGEQPFTGAPNYIGIVIGFLFLLSFFVWNSPLKWIMLILSILSMFMGLGRHFLGFNEILFNYLPLYNKFRSPTMALSIVNIIAILSAAFGLNEFLKEKKDADLFKKLKYTVYTMLGLLVLVYLTISKAGFTSSKDIEMFQGNVQTMALIQEDRADMFNSDLLRSFLFVGLIFGLLWLYIKNKLNINITIGIIGLLAVLDLWVVDARFYSPSVFQKVSNNEDLVPAQSYDAQLMMDTSHFRMINYSNGSVFNANTDGFRYSNIGGYSPAKLYLYQDLIDVHLSKGTLPVLSMLNTKYIINKVGDQENINLNEKACGNAWYVNEVKWADNANAEIDSLNTFDPKTTAWIDKRYKSESNYNGSTDSESSIVLSHYHPDNMVYEAKSKSGGFAVFSEIWYKGNKDWKIFIDGKESKMIRTNYLLRGAYIPAGNHKIEMKFDVPIMDQMYYLAMICSIILLVFGGFCIWKFRKDEELIVK